MVVNKVISYGDIGLNWPWQAIHTHMVDSKKPANTYTYKAEHHAGQSVHPPVHQYDRNVWTDTGKQNLDKLLTELACSWCRRYFNGQAKFDTFYKPMGTLVILISFNQSAHYKIQTIPVDIAGTIPTFYHG